VTDKHKVRFEPVGIEIDVAEDQTILRAASEQGIMLMHGCKEGQCAACKSFILEGEDVEHDKYSTFALPDYEKDEGYTLLCRAHAYEDLTIELLNYDEEMIRSGLPIQQAVAEVVSKDRVTHDMCHLVLRLIEPAEVKFFPGQYMDISVPGTDQVRSFSMANTSSRDGLLEFVIKVYPDGVFSTFLDEQLKVGDRLELTGPFGVFTLRDADTELFFVGGGAGMAPILALLRTMAERGIARKATFFYGARGQRDLCFEEELRAIAEKLPNFSYIPALSDHDPAHGDWDGETGFVTDVVKRLATGAAGAHAYVCGPPPMVEAAIPLLTSLGVAEKRIYFDKFTTTGEPQ
jgi:propane monooxygenase reductase component